MNDYKVRLRGPNNEDVIFEASAILSERRDASYDGYGITHLPTALISYRSTSSRSFSISGKLISRNEIEALDNSIYLNRIRKWLLPDFGNTGATPPILTLYGYRNKNIDGKKVVLKSYDWNFPEDVDYITTVDQPMPIIGTINLSIEEVYTAEEVTAGAWKIVENRSTIDGLIEKKRETSDSFVLTWLGNGRYDPLQTKIPASNIGSIMSQLAKKPTTIPGVIAGALTRTLGNQIIKSSAIKEITKHLPPVLENIFVSGATIAITEARKLVTVGVSSVTQSSSFSREKPLANTKPIGES